MRHFRILDGDGHRPIAPDSIDPFVRPENLQSTADRFIEAARHHLDAVLGTRGVAAADFAQLGRHVPQASIFAFCSLRYVRTETAEVPAMSSADKAPEDAEALRLADSLIEKPLTWSRACPAPSDTPVLSFVQFRAFVRAVTQYRSMVLLLRSGQWEDALILVRSLYELALNLSEISSAADPEPTAKTFVAFGKFQQLRLEQKRLEDELRDEKLGADSSAQEITECEQKTASIASVLERRFAQFRTANGKWRGSWSGVSVETLAQRLAKQTGAQRGQNDYLVFRLGSLFTHNTPGALFLALPHDCETADWNQFSADLDKAGREGGLHFLHEASVCFVDIVGMAGSFIAGYEREWFDEFALPLLKKF